MKEASIAIMLLGVMLSPQAEKEKQNAEKYLACREYRVETYKDKSMGQYRVGIDCRLKVEEKAMMRKIDYRRI